MTVTAEFIQHLTGIHITHCKPISGGNIANSYLLTTPDDERLFLKYHPSPPTSMFPAEATGLKALSKTGVCTTPDIVAVGSHYLLLEHIKTKPADNNYWEKFGHKLAQLHLTPQASFGFEQDNYCGLTPQINTIEADGFKFFGEHRLGFQANLAVNRQLINSKERQAIQNIIDKLPELLPKQSPALIHGDLWSGNHLCRQDGKPILIDTATHRGWAEAEIAMTQLFGGFPEAFYNAYLEENPLQPGWQQRLPLYNLYHLLNHLNLFGSSYHGKVISIVTRWG